MLASGIPADELDLSIRPQDDMFRHVNGRWLARTEIPADLAGYGSFRILTQEADKAVREIVEEAGSAPEGSEERKLGDLYASFMDADRAELLGSRPNSQTLAAARAVSSIPELLETLGRLQRLGIGGLYRLFVDTDPGQPVALPGVFRTSGHLAAGRELLPGGALRWRPRRVRWSCATHVRAGRVARSRPGSQTCRRGAGHPGAADRGPRHAGRRHPSYLGAGRPYSQRRPGLVVGRPGRGLRARVLRRPRGPDDTRPRYLAAASVRPDHHSYFRAAGSVVSVSAARRSRRRSRERTGRHCEAPCR